MPTPSFIFNNINIPFSKEQTVLSHWLSFSMLNVYRMNRVSLKKQKDGDKKEE
jgi:hypothetical protein